MVNIKPLRCDYRWLDKAIIEAIVQALIQDAEMDWIQRDGTVIRAHKHAAGAPIEKGSNIPVFELLPWRVWHKTAMP